MDPKDLQAPIFVNTLIINDADRLGLTPAFGFQMKDVPVADALDVVRVGGVA